MNKSLLITIIGLITISNLHAQNAATPNPGFESWSQVSNYWTPAGWNNLNPSTAILGVFTCQRATAPADVHSGALAIKLTTKSVFTITANGIASTATLITSPPYGVTGGIPYTQRPDSIVGWYKCSPASAADSGFVQFVLLGAANDTIGFVKHNLPNTPVTTYTRFSKPVTYFSPATPVTSYWILSSSDGVNPVINSSIIIDDLDLIFNSTGIASAQNEPLQFINTVVVDQMLIFNGTAESYHIHFYDVAGRILKPEEILSGHNTISLSSLSQGMYIYHVTDRKNNKVQSGKFLKL